MSQGNWYELVESDGVLSGADPTIGAGTFDAQTGTATVTLGALPDAGSQVMWVWSSAVHYSQRLGPLPAANREIRLALNEPAQPGSVTLTYLSDGQLRTATANTTGYIEGDGTGYVAHAAGELWFSPALMPDISTQIQVEYAPQSTVTRTFEGGVESGGLVSLALGEAILPGSLTAAWSTNYTERWSNVIEKRHWYGDIKTVDVQQSSSTTQRIDHIATDNGEGGIVGAGGFVSYANGDIQLPVLPPISQTIWDSNESAWETRADTEASSERLHRFTSGLVTVSYISQSAAADPPRAVAFDWSALEVRVLPPLLVEPIVPGSLRFEMGARSYEDRGTGILYTDSPSGAIEAGAINYQSGVAALTEWAVDGGPVVTACLTRRGNWVGVEASFRTELTPLKPEALSIVVTTEDGEQLTASADADGVIAGPDVLGAVNYEFGTAVVAFGHFEGQTWVPRRVDPSTLRYNAVAYSYLPLDADILGIDGTRLPADGRVPIYRPGDLVMILHAAETTLNLSPGVATEIGRTRLAWVRVTDATGAVVSGERYQLDRAAGQIMFPDLDGLTPPLTVRHTVGDLRQVTDAQISGWLALSRPLTHDYPAGETIVAGCLIIGDRRARVSATWDQASWSGEWADAPSGSAATATLNLIDHPIQVSNEGCDTDRWVLRCANAASDQWELISENRGLVWQGVYAPGGADIAPINPRTRIDLGGGAYSTGAPYMTIPAAANGGGWSTGNVVRIDTVGAIAEFWVARSIQQSDEPTDSAADGCEIHALGNVDRP
ncbi:hypothetical protein HF203_13445 [Marichromatium bheemlicum]|uniref:Uncharacterized protein n=2 Tax=Marichromatium bheemlicum TaxID=365339 RepID=A0ABX1IDH8_9GAMM|nr:hypothetical protein [Marichromatium bheemlicum]